MTQLRFVRWASRRSSSAASAAAAQTSSTTTQTTQPASQSSDASTRPATTTFFGDTGFWFVPTAEVLAHGKWSVSGYRRGTNYIQGYTNVADFAGTFAVGIKDRAEDLRRRSWSTRASIATCGRSSSTTRRSAASSIAIRASTGRGRATTSATSTSARRSICWSEYRQNPAALAVRGMREAADRRTRTSATSTGKSGRPRRLHRQQGNRRRSSRCRATRGMSSAASRTASTRRRARSTGAPARRFPSRSPLRIFTELNGVRAVERAPRPSRRPRSSASTAAVPPAGVEYREPDAGDGRRSRFRRRKGFFSAAA